MKYIQKGAEPQEFTDWKALANDNWQPTYESCSGTVKSAVKETLMREQGFICCYCERRLSDTDSHIEHLRPQSMPGVDPLDFANLLCSCQRELRAGEPLHCGNLKGCWHDASLLVSPVDPTCEARFSFYINGEIRAAHDDDNGAIQTIDRLGLGIPKLNALRRSAIEPFLDPGLSTEEVARFAEGYLQLGVDGMFGEFFTTIRYLFGSSAISTSR